ncbi:MAG: hypothetical protein DRQ55_12200 [Planctomycetota bacterium]|nr:MAG: hypothetical protein DRQ55_12200 [Planctomycetota bacterium]
MLLAGLLLTLFCLSADDEADAGSPRPLAQVIEALDGRRWQGRLSVFRDGQASLQTDQGALQLAPGELLLVSALRAGEHWEAPPRGRDLVLLPRSPGAQPGSAGLLAGRLVAGDEFGLTLALDAGLELTLPYERVERLLPGVDRPVDLLAALDGAGLDDRVWRRREGGGLDGVAGVLVQVDAEQLLFEGSLGQLRFSLDDVLAVVLAEPDAPGQRPEGWPCLVALAGGSRFAAALRSVQDGRVRLATAFAGEFELPLAALDTLLLSPRADAAPQVLTHEPPVHVSEWSLLAPDEPVLYPWRVGFSVAGQPLAVGGVLAASGLGVHAHSRLVFEVPEGVGSLRAAVGLTDDVLLLPATGSVGVVLSVDGEERARFGPLTAADGALPLRLEGLRPGQRVELLVDDGGDDEAGDRAAWIDAVWLP